MKKFMISLFITLFMLTATCFAYSATSGRTDSNNAFRIAVQAPANSKLIYDKMPAFTLTTKSTSGKPIYATMYFYDGVTGKFLQKRTVNGSINFIPPYERRSYIVIIKGSQTVVWTVRKNTKATGNRYNYEVYRMNYSPDAVG